MLVGVFGLPGGAEWLVIALVIVLLFVPSLALFWFGYVLGRKSAAGTGVAKAGAVAGSSSPPSIEGTADGEGDD
jgi:hypothetical protein